MDTFQQFEYWSASHNPRWLVIIRVGLGVALFVKGISFMLNAVTIDQLIGGTMLTKEVDWLPLIITWAHLLGGFLIIIGLLTRWAALLQIPILIGAIFFVVSKEKMLGPGSELLFAIVILLLLLFFLVEGGGPISVDNYIRQNRKVNNTP
jgi:putative oxidoreductase